MHWRVTPKTTLQNTVVISDLPGKFSPISTLKDANQAFPLGTVSAERRITQQPQQMGTRSRLAQHLAKIMHTHTHSPRGRGACDYNKFHFPSRRRQRTEAQKMFHCTVKRKTDIWTCLLTAVSLTELKPAKRTKTVRTVVEKPRESSGGGRQATEAARWQVGGSPAAGVRRLTRVGGGEASSI